MGRCLLIQSDQPPTFWAEAIGTANYIRNRCPISSLNGRIPFELWFKRLPHTIHFKEFGLVGYAMRAGTNNGKFDPRSDKDIFVGYSDETKGYKVWLINKRKFEMDRNVKFINAMMKNENNYEEFYPERDSNPQGSSEEYRIIRDSSPEERSEEHRTANDSEADNEINPQTNEGSDDYPINRNNESDDTALEETPRTQRGRGRPRLERTGLRGRPRKLYNEVSVRENDETNLIEDGFVCATELKMDDVMKDSNVSGWLEVMSSEIKSIIKDNAWQIVSRPTDQNVIGSRFVLTLKRDSEGRVETKKARIVAKGFAQRFGVDFNETSSPVSRRSTIRLIMSLASRFNMKINQIDITTAYMNGTLTEDIFMETPKHFKIGLEYLIEHEAENSHVMMTAKKMLADLKKGNRVCYLKIALYGLKQAGRQWFQELSGKLLKYDLRQSNYDPCVFFCNKSENLMIVCVYVDDILICCQDDNRISKLREHLQKHFEFKRQGNAITMKQSNHIQDLLEKFNMSEANACKTPMATGLRLERATECDDKPYRELIGGLMYLATTTSPDIAHTVSV